MTLALCRLEDIEDGAARGFSLGGFSLEEHQPQREIFLVRRGDRVYGYLNSCPHIGTPLEFLPDRFLTADRTEILCSTHGARFDIATGHCIAGPCRGKALQAVPLHVENGTVVLNDDVPVGHGLARQSGNR